MPYLTIIASNVELRMWYQGNQNSADHVNSQFYHKDVLKYDLSTYFVLTEDITCYFCQPSASTKQNLVYK